MNKLKIKDFVVINIETSGLNFEKDDTICISAVKVVDDKITDEFFSFVKPSKSISKQISTITGITNNMLKDAPSIEEVMQKFFAFVGDFILISYNVKFDISFINKYLDNHNIKRYETYIDILDFAKGKLSNLPNYAFNSVCKALNLELPKSLKEETVTMANVYKILRDKKYNAIFLDIDGVINNENTLDHNGALVRIDNSLLEKFAEVVKSTDSVIILISDWKDYWEKDKSNQHKIGEYLDYKFSCECLKISDKIAGSSFERGKNIKEFLQNHDIGNFVILDDIEFDYIDEGLSKNYIQTDSKKGLTAEDVEKALEIING